MSVLNAITQAPSSTLAFELQQSVGILDCCMCGGESEALPTAISQGMRTLGYWCKQLESPPVLEIVLDLPRPAVLSGRGGRVGVALGSEVVAGMKTIGRACGCTGFMCFLGTFQLLLSRYSRSEEVVVGVAHAPNSVAMRLDLSTDTKGDGDDEEKWNKGNSSQIFAGNLPFIMEKLPLCNFFESHREVK